MNRPNHTVANTPPVRSVSGKYYHVNQNVQPSQGKLLYVVNKQQFVRVLPPNSYPPAPFPTQVEPPKPISPSRMPSHDSVSGYREPLRESSESSELSKIHNRNAWLKNSIPAPPLPDPVSDSEEDYSEEEEDSPRSSPLFHHRHLYNFSESESPIKDLDPALSSDYDEDEEDSPRSSPIFHHRHRYNSDSETPYYSPSSETSVDYSVPSTLAPYNKNSESSNIEDSCALTSKECIPAPLYTSPSLQDLVPDSEELALPTSSPLKTSPCDNPSGPLAPFKNESRPRFLGVKQVSLKGRHDVLVYSIPETDNAYVFCHERTNVDYQIFKCLKCWNEKVKTTIKVIGNEFFGNPCELAHVCSPVDELEDRVERLTYKWLTDLQEQSKSCRNVPKEEYANFLIWLRDDSDEDEWTRKALLNIFKQSGGYREHQELFARFCKPKKARIEDHIEKFVQQSLSVHESCRDEYMGWEDSDLDENFRPEKISTSEVLEWIAGMSENEKFYAF